MCNFLVSTCTIAQKSVPKKFSELLNCEVEGSVSTNLLNPFLIPVLMMEVPDGGSLFWRIGESDDL